MNGQEFTGDLYYIDREGNQWKITQRPGERNPSQHYWHADLVRGDGHRVSASAYRLLIGIDSHKWESEHDGATKESDSESDDATDPERYGVGLWQFHTEGQNCLHPNHPEACKFPRDIENRRQAYLY